VTLVIQPQNLNQVSVTPDLATSESRGSTMPRVASDVKPIVNDSNDELSQWVDYYTFSEVIPPAEFTAYQISVYFKDGNYYADILIKGNLSWIHVLADVVGDSRQIQFLYKEDAYDKIYDPDSYIPPDYKIGDMLFSFSKQNQDIITTWGEIKPLLSDHIAQGIYLEKQRVDTVESTSIADELVGIWQDYGAVADEYSGRYLFNRDGTFIYITSDMDSMNRDRFKTGTWSITNNELQLEIKTQIIIEGGKLAEAPDRFYISDGNMRYLLYNPSKLETYPITQTGLEHEDTPRHVTIRIGDQLCGERTEYNELIAKIKPLYYNQIWKKA